MIENITPEELQEAAALAKKGWSACNEQERSRWTSLHAKAHLARSKQTVLEIIETSRLISRIEP